MNVNVDEPLIIPSDIVADLEYYRTVENFKDAGNFDADAPENNLRMQQEGKAGHQLKISKFHKIKAKDQKSNHSSLQQESLIMVENFDAAEEASPTSFDEKLLLEQQQEHHNMYSLFKKANELYVDHVLEGELSHISEEITSRFDETSGQHTIKSRF